MEQTDSFWNPWFRENSAGISWEKYVHFSNPIV